jgi:hypothetical protein
LNQVCTTTSWLVAPWFNGVLIFSLVMTDIQKGAQCICCMLCS